MDIKSYVMHPAVTHTAAFALGAALVWAMFVKRPMTPTAGGAAGANTAT